MPELRNCQRCGRPYPYAGSEYCRDCLREIDRQYDLVREYLRNEPDVGIEELSARTGVDAALILRFLREGRLVHAKSGLTCERCGAAIPSGRFCAACAEELRAALSGAKDATRFYGAPRYLDDRRRDGGA